MNYQVLVLPRAIRQLKKIPKDYCARIEETMLSLTKDPRPPGISKLVTRVGYRIRVGEYRIIFEIDDANKIVTVLDIGHRRDVYD